MKNKEVFLIGLSLIILSLGFLSAEPISDDLHLNIQTINSSGNPTTGTFNFTFNISTTSTCNSVVYTNTSSLTTDSRGIISYYLINVSLNFSEQYYLCYYKDGTLMNSSKIARTPYTFRAQNITISGIQADSNLNVGTYNITASWFKGLFNWTTFTSWLIFDGATLSFNETRLNDSMLWKNVSGTADYNGNVNISGNFIVNKSVFFVNSTSGNVGIGTANPTYTLGISSGQDSIVLFNTVSAAGSPFFGIAQGGTRRAFLQYLDTGDLFRIGNEYGGLAFLTGTNGADETEKMRIDSSGNIGIGTSSPSAKLNVNGSINVTGNSFLTNTTFNGGWLNNGVSIVGGEIFAQTAYLYNLTSLSVSNLNINGSMIPAVGFDNTFDLGSSSLKWRDIFASRNITTGSYFNGLFNWTTLTSWLSFNGATLSFNETRANNTFVNVDGDTMTSNLSMGYNSITNIRSIILNTSENETSHIEGQLHWDFDEKTYEIDTDITDVHTQIGRETITKVVNKAGQTILNGQVVYVSGASGNRAEVKLARADNVSTAYVLGIATHDIADNAEGYVTVRGYVNGLDTSAYSIGDVVYLSPTQAGNWTLTKPAYPNFRLAVGTILTAHANIGRLEVKCGLDYTDGVTIHDLYVLNNISSNQFTLSNTRLQNLSKNSAINGEVLGISMTGPSGVELPHFALQSGGPSQASYIMRSFMIVNENASFFNGTERTNCVSYMNNIGETLKIDCNTTTTGADLLVSDDMQVVGDTWMKDADGEWHYETRELKIRDQLFRDIVESRITSSISGLNLSIQTLSGKTIFVNINETNYDLGYNGTSILLTQGTNSSPVFNHVYFSSSGTPVLSKSTTAQTEVPDVAQSLIGGGYDFGSVIGSATNDEFIRKVYHSEFDRGALYKSGFNITANTTAININNGVMQVVLLDYNITSSLSTSTRINRALANGSFQILLNNLNGISTYYGGETIGNAKYFNLVCGVVLTADNTGRLYCVAQDKPTTEYSTTINAETDAYQTVNIYPNHDFIKKIYVPVARIVIQRSSGVNTIQQLSNGQYFLDLRGTSGLSGGNSPSPSITSHSDLTNLNWASAGHTFDTNLTVSGYDVVANKFFGLFNWTTLTSWLSFNGANLDFNETRLNDSMLWKNVSGTADYNGNVNISGNLTIRDRVGIGTTDPSTELEIFSNSSAHGAIQTFYQNSSSPENGDSLGRIYFKGLNSTGANMTYGYIDGAINQASTGRGKIQFILRTTGGTYKTHTFTDTSVSLVDGQIFTQSSKPFIVLGTSNSGQTGSTVQVTSTNSQSNGTSGFLQVAGTYSGTLEAGLSAFSITSTMNTGGSGGWKALDINLSADVGTGNKYLIWAAVKDNVKFVVTNDSKVGIGIASPSHLLTVNGNANLSGLMYVNSTNVGIGTSTPQAKLEIADNSSATPLRVVDSSNVCNFGVDGSGWASISCSSDEKLKENIIEIPQEKLKEIANWVFNYPLKEYTWKSNGEITIGAIAQEVQALDPTKVKDENGILFVETPTIKDLLVAIKEIFNWNTEQDKTINKMNQTIQTLQQELCLKDNTYSWC